MRWRRHGGLPAPRATGILVLMEIFEARSVKPGSEASGKSAGRQGSEIDAVLAVAAGMKGLTDLRGKFWLAQPVVRSLVSVQPPCLWGTSAVTWCRAFCGNACCFAAFALMINIINECAEYTYTSARRKIRAVSFYGVLRSHLCCLIFYHKNTIKIIDIVVSIGRSREATGTPTPVIRQIGPAVHTLIMIIL